MGFELARNCTAQVKLVVVISDGTPLGRMLCLYNFIRSIHGDRLIGHRIGRGVAMESRRESKDGFAGYVKKRLDEDFDEIAWLGFASQLLDNGTRTLILALPHHCSREKTRDERCIKMSLIIAMKIPIPCIVIHGRISTRQFCEFFYFSLFIGRWCERRGLIFQHY